MPDLSVPEVRLKDRLPEGLRDMTMDDIQRALPEVHLPRLDLGREASKASRNAEKAAARAAKRAEKARRGLEKAAARRADRAARAVENVLPRRAGPNPVPIAIFAMLGGIVVGWILATNPVTGPRVSRWLDDLRSRWEAWRGRGPAEAGTWDTSEPRAYPESLRAPVEPERFAGELPERETGVGVGPGQLPDGMGTSDPASVGADDTGTFGADEPGTIRADEPTAVGAESRMSTATGTSSAVGTVEERTSAGEDDGTTPGRERPLFPDDQG